MAISKIPAAGLADIAAAVEGASDSNKFSDADHSKLNGVAASANNYVHPNHSGEVTSTADGAQVVADNIIDEANLKVSNAPTNGQFLSAQSGNTGGLTWAAIPAGVGGATGVDFNDNVKARFGTGNDLEIYHDGSHSYIKDVGTGNLSIQSQDLRIGDSSVSNKAWINCFSDAEVRLYHNNVQKFETTSTGVAVTGKVTSDGVYNNGDLVLESNSNIYLNRQTGGGATMLKAVVDGAVELYHDNSKKFETTSGGATVSGALTATAGSGAMLKAQEGGGSYAFLEAGGSANYLEWKSGDKLHIREDDNANYMIFNDNHTIDHYGTAGNWMKMWFAGSTNNEYFVSFRMSNNSQVGTIQTNGSTVSYNTSSDYRLKENVDYTWDATTRLKQLKPARFNWIADETNTVVDGFIAHEVEGIVPEAISGAKDAMEAAVLYQEGDELPEGKEVGDVKVPEQISPQSIDQAKLVPLLVKTIQELEARITALEE